MMRKNKSLQMLIKFASKLTYNTQESLLTIEDELSKNYNINIITESSDDTRRFLALSSLPFAFKSLPQNKINEFWEEPMNCRECKKSVMNRHVLSTGNLRPKYFIVGDIPYAFGGNLYGGFERAYTYGPDAIMLRKALNKLGIYSDCWFATIIKCCTENNVKPDEIVSENCMGFLLNELEALFPKKIITLGPYAKDFFERRLSKYRDIVINVKHPRSFIKKHKAYEDYYKHLKERIENADSN